MSELRDFFGLVLGVFFLVFFGMVFLIALVQKFREFRERKKGG